LPPGIGYDFDVKPDENRDGRRILAEGDLLAKEGDVAGAVEQYNLYCENVEASGSDGASNLRLIAIRRQVLVMLSMTLESKYIGPPRSSP
jgi:hypothetical protein